MNTALLVIDIQNDYFPGGTCELFNPEKAAYNASLLIKNSRAKKLPVFHIRHIASNPGATFFIPDTNGSEIHETVRPAEGENIIIKHFPNSFRKTELLEKLQDNGTDNLIICGMMSHMCIDATTRAAFDFGFSCSVAHDACTTKEILFNGISIPATQVHNSFMGALNNVYAKIQSTAEIIIPV